MGHFPSFFSSFSYTKEGKGREGKEREGKGREGKGKEGKERRGKEGKGKISNLVLIDYFSLLARSAFTTRRKLFIN